MIKSLVVPKIPFMGCETIELEKYNFLFGNNGTGKSSIARMIYKETNKESSQYIDKDTNTEVLVFDKDYAKRNFKDKTRVPGVYLLGEDAGKFETEIESLKEQFEASKKKAEGLRSNEATLFEEEERSYTAFTETCWGTTDKQRKKFGLVLDGRKQKNSFAQFCIENYSGKAIDATEEGLLGEISRVYSNELVSRPLLEKLKVKNLTELESSPILRTLILSESNIDFNELIVSLGNSDWVHEGLSYLALSNRRCPFCQQTLTVDLVEVIRSVFSSKYEKDIHILEEVYNSYVELTDDIENQIYYVLQERVIGYDYTLISENYEALKQAIQRNIHKIDEKRKEPSKNVEVESLIKMTNNISTFIDQINKVISENNIILQYRKDEQKKLTQRVGEYIANNILFAVIHEYKERTDKQLAIIKKIQEKANKEEEGLKYFENEIRILKGRFSSIDRTIEFMQRTMDSIGYTSFRVVATSDNKAFRIIREDGSCVEETLSEGEFSFLSFLYFYFMIVGTSNENQADKKKAVVIDDPISSLDSNGLFYVAGLIDLIIRKHSIKNGIVEQLIILTHNSYFLKQLIAITSDNQIKVKFYMIEKGQKCSSIFEVTRKYFESSYESLWRIVVNYEDKHSQLVLNAMRRIIDDFVFNYVGRNKYDLCEKMPQDYQNLYRTLLIITNAGSHDVPDDFAFCNYGKDIDKYFDLFKQIFIVAGFEDHYKLMINKVKN